MIMSAVSCVDDRDPCMPGGHQRSAFLGMPHGNDIGSWEGYEGNEQYDYYNSVGYHFYCNVDGSVPYWVQITDHYVRQGRIDVDGYRLWLAQNGQDSSLSKLIDLTGIFNQERPTPVVANGES